MNLNFELKSFPTETWAKAFRVNGSLNIDSFGLVFIFGFFGPTEQILIRDLKEDFWKTTCFEIFCQQKAKDSYLEFNFSPLERMQAFEFANYRNRIEALVDDELFDEVDLEVLDLDDRSFEMKVLLPFSFLEDFLDMDSELNVGVSAILEHSENQKSHWALSHLGQQPDFHLHESFQLKLPALSSFRATSSGSSK